MTKKISQEEWDRRASRVGLKWVDDVGRSDTKVLSDCLFCGTRTLRLPSNVAKGQGCSACAQQRSRSSSAQWQERARKLGFEWVEGTPVLVSDRTKFGRCLACGNIWLVSPSALYAGRGHPRCPAKSPNSPSRVSFEEWQKRAKEQGLVFLEQPLNSKSPTLAECVSCGHEWKPRPINVSHLGSGCPKCRPIDARKKVLESKSKSPAARAHRYLVLAKAMGVEWLGGLPERLGQRHAARCAKCGYEWEPWVANVVSKGTGCPVCAKNSRVSQSEWDKRAAAVGLEWLSPVAGRHKKALAKCVACGVEKFYEAGVVSLGHGCSECGAKKASINQRLSSEVWEDRAATKSLRWVEVPGNNFEKRPIECLACGHAWQVRPASLAGCPVCAGKFVPEGEWERRAAARGLRWTAVPEGSREASEAECLSCGLIWSTTADAVSSGSGCPDCAETGFKPGQPAYLYFVEDPGRGARKIGISNEDSKSVRLKAHRRNGFEREILVLSSDSGFQIAELEAKVMAWIRLDCGLPPFLGKLDMPQRGWTETFSMEGPSNVEVVAKIKEFAEQFVKP